jgi:hypothetical protein
VSNDGPGGSERYANRETAVMFSIVSLTFFPRTPRISGSRVSNLATLELSPLFVHERECVAFAVVEEDHPQGGEGVRPSGIADPL